MAKDLFSIQPSLYARYRPVYPNEIYAYIMDFVKEKNAVWDCGTGNGQAAFALADHFKNVFATDISKNQLAVAREHPNIKYLVCPAEQTPFSENTFDLITVAQAYHWFDFNSFQKEATRVGKNEAVVAVWGYNLMTAHHKALDHIIHTFYSEIVGPYWDPERLYLENNYQTAPFGFQSLPSRNFFMNVEWKKDDLVGYLLSWSAVQHYIKDKNANPVNLIIDELTANWKDGEIIQVSFPLFLKLGRIIK